MSIRTQAIEQPTRPSGAPTINYRPRSTYAMNTLQLLYEAMSRARMRKPQRTTSEAYRPARQVALAARREQMRQLGLRD
jgi:hypothetical protein